MSELQIAVLVVGGYVMMKVIDWAVAKFLKRTVETEYQTATACRLCREECMRSRTQGTLGMQGEMADFGRGMDLMRGILLVIAVKVGVDDETIERLAYGPRRSDK